jgi:hypothetical protein
MTIREVFIGVAALAATGVALAGAPLAQADAGDVASTQAYVRADYTLVRYANSRIPAAEAALSGIVTGVRRECPRVAAESPQDTDSEQLDHEVIGTMVTTAIRPGLPHGRAFINAVKSLRWSNSGLTHTIQQYVTKLKVMGELPIPNLCSDVKSWVASGFQTLPQFTVSFDKSFLPTWVAIGELPAALTPYETPAVRALASRASKLENNLTEFEARAVEWWGTILDEMVLQP